MANKLVVIQDINKELGNTIVQLEGVDKKVVDISQNLRKSVSGFTGFTLPKDLEASTESANTEIKRLNDSVEEQKKLIFQLQKEIDKLSRKRTSNTKKGLQQRVAEQALRKELRTQVRAVTDLGSAYDNLSAKNNQLIRERQNLAVRQKTNNDLTVEETNRLEDLTLQIQENQRILKTTDQEVGNFRRNVGNYASAYDGLGNSINQITRELPAFTNSVQTGFLAISNNLPILADELIRLNKVNAELIAQGKPTQSVLKQFTKSIFSLQTAISIGVTLLTVYGKELINFVAELFSSEKQLEATAQAQEALNEAQLEGVKAVASEIAETKLLFNVAKDITRSTKERELAVDRLIDSSQGLISSTERQNILNGEALLSEQKLIDALIKRATLTAALALTGENFSKILENRIRIQEKANTLSEINILQGKTEEEKEKNLAELIERRSQIEERSTTRSIDRIAAQTQSVIILDEIIDLTNENNDLQERNNAIFEEAAKISNSFTLGLTDQKTSQEENIQAVKGSIAFLESQISKLEEERKTLATNSEQWNRYTDLIDNATKALSLLQFQLAGIDLQPVGDQIQSETQRIREALDNIFESTGLGDPLEQLTEKAKNELDKQIDDFEEAEKKKLQLLKQALSLQENLRQEFAASLIDSVNIAFDAQIQRYEDEIQANNEYYDALLENRELSEEQRDAIELEREQKEQILRDKQREQERKQFLFNQALAIADIAITLAKTIAQINLNAQLLGPLLSSGYAATNTAIAIGTAAAQTASVLAQQPPQFAEGKNFRDNYEGLAIWGEKKRELKISRNGSVELSPKKIGNHLTYVKKDDIIIPDANEYLNGLSDDQLTSDLSKHIYYANVANQNRILHNKSQANNSKIIGRLDMLNNTLERKQMKFILNQDMRPAAKELAKQMKYLNRKNNTL